MTQSNYRRRPLFVAIPVAALFAVPTVPAELIPDPPHDCEYCAGWSQPREPFRVFGNTWFVGGGVSSVLITTPKGHVLIDGGLTQTAPQVAANIAKLGFRLEDIKVIVNSHTHYDHAGGIAALQRASGAPIAASPEAARALERGGPTENDPQFGFGPAHNNFPAVAKVRIITDGDTIKLGGMEVTAHYTPGHTPGGTSWTWKSCENDRCLNMVYADSLNSVSAPGFKFSADAKRVAEFEKSIETVAGLPCDILLTPHPEAFDLDARIAARDRDPKSNPFLDPNGCKAYAAGARERLAKRIAEERATP
jgi:metallo-beta-lactamase class B